MNKQLIRQIKTLAHKECCNYVDGKCVYDHNCYVINPRYPTVHDGAIDCDYFLESVLPLEPELKKNVWAELLHDEDMTLPPEKNCARCGQPFVPGSNRQQYCAHCKPLHDRIRLRDNQRQYYHRKQGNGD